MADAVRSAHEGTEPVCVMEASVCSLLSNSPGQAGGSQVPQKNVTIAPSSRLLSDRHYTVRQPLFSQHTSILKKSPAGHSTEQTGLQSDMGPKTQATTVTKSGTSLQTRLREGHPPLYSEHSLSGDRSRISPIVISRPPSSVLQVHRLSTPVRPRLSSPVLHPRYTPLSTHRRKQNDPEQHKSSLYQTEYWACAIPKDPPPTPSGRDPHQDYEALLDYTYPLKPVPRARDWTLQDSGIEMDLLSSGLSDLNMSGMEHPKDFVLGSSSPDLMGTTFSLADHVLAVDRPEWSKQKNTMVSAISDALITLPWDRGIQKDVDEEFRPLPGQIEQLQQLSQQVREAAARFQPVHWEPPLSPSPTVGQDTPDTVEAHQRTGDLEDHLWTEDSVDSLRGQEKHSLMEHISVFCGHLEQLIHWLYAASQTIDQLAPPTVDIHSVKSSLAQYQSFQQDVNSHMPLTSSVLQTGRLLLRCVHSTSPVLRDTLLLIESQSRLLERHTEHFFSSILSAMDSLTQPQTEGRGPQTSSERGESTTES